MTRNDTPITHQGDLAKLPKALTPLIERKQWCVWRWTQKPGGSWQKPPFMPLQPDRHANTNDPNTWTDYATALATVQARQADGIRSGRGDRSRSLPLHCYEFDRRGCHQ
jgi:primase-polymerase (primpol)-like protein